MTQFDPRNEWVDGQLRGYRLPDIDPSVEQRPSYVPIMDNQSLSLNLRLVVEGKLLRFYRLDNGQRLLWPGELVDARQEAEAIAERERQRADELAARLARYE